MPESNEPIQEVHIDPFAERQAYVDEMFNSGYDQKEAETSQAELDRDRQAARIAQMEAELAELEASNSDRWEAIKDWNLMAEFEEADRAREAWEADSRRIGALREQIRIARG